ncbi:trypsin-like peptidase [Aliiruegeria haliotis]|uniref:Trypsin-like peptidase n=1 Tax=Aliiruegeria haliotis TaxID=1280846 RepID=A0A2T0RY61_9RHOB|nr:serine protease [Aliiruegeria haliotis]PRY26126.1 trypsin-like peptidase [Aliiruegeria haliotis]
MLLTVARLRPAVEGHAALVDRALAALFTNPDLPMNLDGLTELAGPDDDVTDLLLAILNEAGVKNDFVSFLRARGVDLKPPASLAEIWDAIVAHVATQTLGAPEDADFDFDALARFAARAKAFRCRIKVAGHVAGSGAFVSPRMVLTAEHVIAPFTDVVKDHDTRGEAVDPADLPRVTILDSNGQEHLANVAWWLPVHPEEHAGRPPPADAGQTHCDVALLKVVKPVGRIHGCIPLPDPPIAWTGTRRFALVHYPDGAARGFCPGVVRRRGGGELRLLHNVDTEGGSSGGAGFDRDFGFLGLHQGRVDQLRQLVPFELYAGDTAFRSVLGGDLAPKYLWSLDGDIDGQLVIGRANFFLGLGEILEHPEGKLRGLWVRRLPGERTTGLSFSFDILRAFLALQEDPARPTPRHVCHQIPTAMGQTEMIDPIARALLGEDAADAARPGVRAGETSKVAEERDRAERLVRALDTAAAEAGQIHWFFFEPPPDEGQLAETALIQIEHLVDWITLQKNLRIVLAGFEEYKFAPLLFQRIEDAAPARRPGLLSDPVGTFTREDVLVTLKGALADLTPTADIDQPILEDLTDQVVHGLQEARPGAYRRDALATAVDRVRERVKLRMGDGA